MKVYGKPNTSEAAVDIRPKGFVRIIGDKERPTPEYICSINGIWILPDKTNEVIALERKQRYIEEADELKEHIITDIILGVDVTEKKERFNEIIKNIKQDLPFIDE